MTPEQFAALAELLHMRAGPSQECARLVLVDGMQQARAAEATGLNRQAAFQAVKRARETMELAQVAAGTKPPGA